MSSPQFDVMIEGESYRAQLGRIEETSLGFEDHGFLTCYVHLDFSGTGQAFGGFVLGMQNDKSAPPELGVHAERWVRGILNVVGVDYWEKLKGKYIHALRADDWGIIVGIMSWDGSRTMLALGEDRS